MKFSEMVDQASEFLRRRERVSYRALKREFDLDDEALEDLRAELINAQRIAVDEDGKVLVWTGQGINGEKDKGGSGETDKGIKEKGRNGETGKDAEPRTANSELSPVSYTPPHLAERIRAEQVALEARGATDVERKTITALFADLKGSTALIEGLDPEEARAIIDPALQLMMDAVHRYEGYVAQALGDGIFALFGAPLAHEDHPQRALYAALRMQEEMRHYADTLRVKGHPPLLMRVGVNTGEVVVRSIRKDDLHADYVPIGHSTNLAARMEQLAAPGSILVSAYTHKLTEGYFEFKALGQTQVKGVEEPLSVYEVLGAGSLRTRLQVSATRRGLTRFVGRQSEMEQMQRALEQAKAGHGQIVGVMGEPGLGKSRLFYEFKLTSQAGCLMLEAYSVSHGKASPYLPVIELLKNYFQILPPDDERTRRQKVIGKVLELDRSLEDTLPYLFALLGIEEQPSPLQQMDPQIRRRRTFDALKRLFFRESLKQPLILIFEDLHWIDSETQGFLDILSESVASARILLLVNYRPEYRQEWGQKTYYTQLRLAPFGKAEAEEFLTVLLGDAVGAQHAAPLQTLKQLILEKTEGTPFFMEEVVQTLAEEGVLAGERGNYRLTHHAPTLHIPTTVQGVLAARIDRLAPDEKALLQHLAVIGREFPLSVVRQVVPQPDEELYRVLASLQRKEFLYEQPAFPEVEYIFKHALTQEVAYGTVLQEQRKLLHERTGQALETVYGTTLSEHYSDLAHHYHRSANTEKAIAYLRLAGQQALQRSANTEAIAHLTAALDLLLTRPKTPERAAQELSLHLAVGPALMATQGYAASEVGQHYTRARALCEQLGDTPQLFPVLWGIWQFHIIRGDFRAAQALAEECLQLAEKTNEDGLLLLAVMAAGATFLFRGEFVRAQVALEQSAARYQPQYQALTLLYGGYNPRVGSLTNTIMALWYQGYPEQAQTRSTEVLRLARELAHPLSLALALSHTAWLHPERGEGPIAQERANALMTLASEQGFPYWWAWGTLHLGEALIVQKQWAEGVAQVRQGLEVYIGGLTRTYHLTWLAIGYGGTGQVDEGLETIAEALRLVEQNDERFYEAELYRIKGTLTLQKLSVVSSQLSVPSTQPLASNTQAEAEACFLKAIEIARRQQAKSLELRAVMSLSRLWQQQGKHNEAHRMLSEVYNWFTEGFDTRDLQEAKTLLQELKGD